MFEGRASKAVLISLLSTGNSLARGANSLLSTCLICVRDVAADVVHLSTLSSAVSLSVNFFPAYPAERCALNGKVKVVL